MKSKILSIFLVALIVQTQVVQGSPLLGLDLGGIIDTTISNALQATRSLLTNILNAVVQVIGGFTTQVTGKIKSAVEGVSQLVTGDITGGNLTEFSTENTVAIAVIYVLNSATQLAQIKDNALAPVASFYSSLSSLLSNNSILLSTPSDSIKQAIDNIKTELNSNDVFQAAIQITLKSGGIAGDILDAIPEYFSIIVPKIGTTVPLLVSTGLNALNTVADNVNKVYIAVSINTNAFASAAATTSQGLSTTVLPLTGALTTAVNNTFNAVSRIPTAVNNAITAMQNSGNELLVAINISRQEVFSAIASVDSVCANDTATSVDNLSTAAIANGVECLNNEIPTLKNYQTQFQNNEAQYQFGITTNSINISTLRQTVQNSISFLLYLGSAKLRIDACLANILLNFVAHLLPLAEHAITCSV